MSNKKPNPQSTPQTTPQTLLNPAKPNLFEILQKVKDTRDPSGRRHHLAVVLLVNIIAIMSGYTGIRSKQDFIDRNKKELLKIFDPALTKHGLPCKNTIDRTMQVVDFDDLNNAISKVFNIPVNSSIHIDGKAIRSTSKNGQQNQIFTAVVTAFAKGKGIISKSFVNGTKSNEISTVQDIIKALGLEGMVLTLDALHCQK